MADALPELIDVQNDIAFQGIFDSKKVIEFFRDISQIISQLGQVCKEIQFIV